MSFGAVLIGGYPSYREAFANLRDRRMTMDLSMTIALYLPGRGIVCWSQGEEIVVGNEALLAAQGIPCGNKEDGATPTSEALVARNGRLLGTIVTEDTLRPETAAAVRRLRGMGIRTELLTGDVKSVAESVGRRLGVDEVEAEMLPDQKLRRVEELLAEGKKVAMVGDGVTTLPP